MESREFRNALARYPTGVTVVVTRDRDGRLVGLTANSVMPITTSPARLAWSLGAGSRSRAAFEHATYFAVNVLSQAQVDIARQLAAPLPDRFMGLSYSESGCGRLPKFDGCVAWYGCRRSDVLELGDHIMFIGDVVECDEQEGTPLLFFAGRFAQLLD
jgi:flavin reductase (DIM6/NTAB) family NADH-FMN oxidoreductase RutF